MTHLAAFTREPGRAHPIWRWIVPVVTSILLALVLVHGAGVLADFWASIHYPFGLEYGEGIVWQQAELIPGPRMYSNSQDLPFIVFHYPPLYHLLVRAATAIEPSFLSAGRLVSSVSTVLTALAVSALVVTATKRPGHPIGRTELAIACAAGLLMLCLHAVHSWGALMRVDMMAIALGMTGLLMGAWANGRFWGTTMALLLCVASLFTKQTQLPVGIAVFAIALLRNPRGAICAAALAGTCGLGALGLMEALTQGGFLHNIIGYNIDGLRLHNALHPVWIERESFVFMALMLIAAGVIVRGQFPQRVAGTWLPAIGQYLLQLRHADRMTTARAMLLLHFTLAGLMLFTLLKNGSSNNYLLDWLCVGCVLIGVLACDLVGTAWRFSLVTALLILGVLSLPLRQIDGRLLQAQLAPYAVLVGRIAAAENPVASEDMTLLMLASKPVIFEPAIVTALAAVGRWNEAPLVKMVHSGGFAFVITENEKPDASGRYSPAVDAAIRETYPRLEHVASMWLHLPRR